METEIDQPEVESQEEWERKDMERRRLKAYADPETGSDRHFAEAVRLEAQGRMSEAASARAAGLSRYQEIKTAFPMEPTEVEPVVPVVVLMAQAKLELHSNGMLSAVEQLLDELPEPERTAAMIEWAQRRTLEREHPLVTYVADKLPLTAQQLDELFTGAAGR